MSTLPSTADSLLVRTNFSDTETWLSALSFVLAQNGDGFRAYVQVVDDIAWCNADWERIRNAVLCNVEHAAVLFIMDEVALESDYPVLVVDLDDLSHEPFRCVARRLWSVDNNLNLANMDWEEFTEDTDTDGVFRGFA
ncbi:DUF6924 domain-containing protein [Paenarthrobacter sp.]|uniref:DUF6924 domain-containing protein n=1 Tax=Paenarthrobacter sp. TaxID=1931993 RepID=UPI0028110650|nr:hypothetical protein [Paenarthrobacter sp.]